MRLVKSTFLKKTASLANARYLGIQRRAAPESILGIKSAKFYEIQM